MACGAIAPGWPVTVAAAVIHKEHAGLLHRNLTCRCCDGVQ